MLSPWLSAIIGAVTGTTLTGAAAAGTAVAGGVLAGGALGALAEGIRSAVSDSPFAWKSVGLGAGLGGVTAGLGSTLSAGATPAAQAAGEAVKGTALEGAGSVASQAGGPGIGSLLDAGVKVGQGAIDTLSQFNQSFGPSAFVDALESAGTAGELAASTGKGLVQGAAFGAIQNPKDPLKGALSGAASGVVGGLAGGVGSSMPMRSSLHSLAVPDIPGVNMAPPPTQIPMLPSGGYDPTAFPSSLPFKAPSPTMGQAAAQGGVGLLGKAGGDIASRVTGTALTEPYEPPFVDPFANSPFPDFRRMYTRGGGFGY
ncbi:MAG: hypothetical protein FJ090_18530 [Deltaproteobacteria bacterium]|nr:hypothetical protein [Deltaproteobacteria bacterium]